MRVVIVGAGVIGLACAYELVKRGATVTVLDKGDPGAAASWGNAGWIVPSISEPVPAPDIPRSAIGMMMRPDSPLYIKPRLDPAFARWMLAFLRACNRTSYHAGMQALAGLNTGTFAGYDRWSAEGMRFEMHCAGLLFAFLNRERMRRALHDIGDLGRLGYDPPEPLEGRALRERAPILSDDVVGGFVVRQERHVEPASLTAGLIALLRARGGDIRAGVAVRGFTRHGARVDAALTEAGAVPADAYLIAAGAWSGQLAQRAGFRLPMEGGRGYSITVRGARLGLDHSLYGVDAHVAVTPFDRSLRIAGTMELSGVNESFMPRRMTAIRRSALRYLRVWPDGGEEVEWSGMRPLLPDGLPALGRAPVFDNLYVASGHSMLGVTLAPVTGAAMAELIQSGRTKTDLTPFDPARFAGAAAGR